MIIYVIYNINESIISYKLVIFGEAGAPDLLPAPGGLNHDATLDKIPGRMREVHQ